MLTQLTSPWDYGVTVTYSAFESEDLGEATRYSIQVNGEDVLSGWLRVYKKEKVMFYCYLN